jgi:pteridine reductase
MELPGRVALVTGAGRRLGRAIAAALARRGMRLALHHHASAAGAAGLRDEIRAEGGDAECFGADLRDAEAARALPGRVLERFGRLDVLVNSAAVMLRTPIGAVRLEDWDMMFALNVRAPFFLTQHAAPALRRARGCVVNIADLAAFESWPAYVPHGMTKAAIVQMTRALAKALSPEVRVNAVAPGVVLLPEGWSESDAEHLRSTTPLARLGSPEDVAQAVIFLLEADYVTGEVIRVDGGRHVRA